VNTLLNEVRLCRQIQEEHTACSRAGRGAILEGEVPAVPPSGYTVLLVDDDAAIRSLYRRVFHRGGYTVLEAGDSDKAIRLAEEYGGPIHILVTDMVMAGMGGFELSDRVRLLRPGIKVLYLSGMPRECLAEHGQGNVGADFLGKPIPPAMLEHKVREMLA
jgi:two-component system, cell cycle sensor histidine kinase and response regulator CckA